MRRTRHVVLPVKSWQYIGLMVVSLACLTLGLVSRDREGKSGSLTGPELKHNAPHEVDACPNIFPFVLDPASTFMLNEKPSETTNNSPLEKSKGITQEKLVSATREIIANDRRVINHRSRDARNVRATPENRRLTRSDDRSTRSSRSVSLDRRISNSIRTRESSTRRESEATRLQERRVRDMRSSERQNRENRLIDTRRLNSRSLDRVAARVATVDRSARSIRESRDRRSTERRENRMNVAERREQTRSRTVLQPSPESRLLARSRFERTIDNSRERRQTQNVDRRQRQVDRLSRLNRQERKSIDHRNQRTLERSRVADTNERTWVESLRRNARITPLDINGNRYQPIARDTSRDQRRVTPSERQSRLDNRIDERTRRINNRKTNYLMTMPKLPSAKQTLDVGKYEFLRQTFVLALCGIYTASLVQGKNGFLRNILNQANQLTVW